jgi:hypothetical protein
MVTLPVDILMILFLVVVVDFIVSPPDVKAPAPTAIVKLVLFALGLSIVMRPVTANEFVPLIVTPPVFTVESVLHSAG